MRVISGIYKGRNLNGFDIDGTRPTMDRIKESMFAMIQNDTKDAICLDLFCGSGSLGIEAMSEGAKSCYFVDEASIPIKTLKENLKNLNIMENVYLYQKDYMDALYYFKELGLQFDLVFLDPPYQKCYINQVLEMLYQYHLLKKDAKVICEYEQEKVMHNAFTIWKEKHYGDKNIQILMLK